MGNVVESFIDTLQRLESDRELESIVALFAENCEIGNVLTKDKFHGQDGAREFWTHYRDTFGGVRSTFRNRIVGETSAALEWTTEGTAKGGDQIRYDGVSILEIAGDRIRRFHAYFDPNNLGQQISAE